MSRQFTFVVADGYTQDELIQKKLSDLGVNSLQKMEKEARKLAAYIYFRAPGSFFDSVQKEMGRLSEEGLGETLDTLYEKIERGECETCGQILPRGFQ